MTTDQANQLKTNDWVLDITNNVKGVVGYCDSEAVLIHWRNGASGSIYRKHLPNSQIELATK